MTLKAVLVSALLVSAASLYAQESRPAAPDSAPQSSTGRYQLVAASP
jgi:hypothetical protein